MDKLSFRLRESPWRGTFERTSGVKNGHVRLDSEHHQWWAPEAQCEPHSKSDLESGIPELLQARRPVDSTSERWMRRPWAGGTKLIVHRSKVSSNRSSGGPKSGYA